MSLLDTIAKLDTRTITIRGTEVRVRALTALEDGAVESLFPLPRKRYDVDPKGAAHGKVEDLQHPDYIRELGDCVDRRHALRAAIGMGECGGTDGMNEATATALAERVLASLTSVEIARVRSAQEDIVRPAASGDALRIGSGTSAGN
jgi:hypothetical protein